MTAITPTELFHVFYQLVDEIDSGATAPIDEAQDAIIDGEVVDYLQTYSEVDLSLLSDAERDGIDDAIQSWGNYETKRTARNNGLAMIQTNLIMVIDNGVCVNPETDTTVKVADLEIH